MKNSKKGFVVPLLLAIIAVLVIGGGVYVFKNKKAEAPAVVDTGTQQQVQTQPIQTQQQVQGIVIEQPLKNQEVQLPITVKGYLNGNGWAAFEGVAGSVQVFDANNKAISEVALLQATTDWMKPVVHFEATVGDRQMMSNLATQTGTLVFKSDEAKDNSNVKEFRLPIKFTSNQTSNWKTYTNKERFFEFSYPSYADIKNISSAVADTTVVLTPDWMNRFDVTTDPEPVFCTNDPYKNMAATIPKLIKYTEDKVNKYGNTYRHLHETDSSSKSQIITEDKYYLVKNNICYMITKTTSSKVDQTIVSDAEKIFSTFKFTK